MKSLEFSRVSRRTWVVLFILFALIVSGAVATRSQAAASSLNSPDNLWSAVVESSFTTAGQRDIVPAAYGVSRLNLGDMSAMLADAPMEFTTSAETNPTTFYLPMPDGTYAAFRVWESPIMHPDLAAKFPGIKTYAGQGIDNPAATIRFDITPHGFHAQVLSPEGRIMVDPFSRNDTAHYISYTSTDNHRTDLPDTFDQIVDEDGMREEIEALVKQQGAVQTGTELRTYRLALAATGEYTSFHGGTVGDGMAAMTTAMNRVNGIYEVEVAVRMEFIANNNTIIYTNGASDPYTNNSGGTMLGQNKSNLNSVIGSANYDIGHVFSTGGGGIAGLGVICGNNKAWGVTGLSSPINDVFYVDYVAHEMG
ncbi:MAG: hypothetical protein KAG66_12215, partial [Methylococcales bacterium]|nr:hypothetical protein [Methylococcales bacterium]